MWLKEVSPKSYKISISELTKLTQDQHKRRIAVGCFGITTASHGCNRILGIAEASHQIGLNLESLRSI